MFGKLLTVTALLVCLAATITNAADIKWVQIDNSAQLTGYLTYDLYIRTDGGWCCNAMLFELSTGEFYQDAFGGLSTPNPAFYSLVPTLEFDTYLTENEMGVNILGAGGDVGGDDLAFDTTELDVSWNTRLRPSQTTGWIRSARITFSDDAEGAWALLIAEGGFPSTGFSGTIADIVPEPSSVWLLIGSVFGLFGRRCNMHRRRVAVRSAVPRMSGACNRILRFDLLVVAGFSALLIGSSTTLASVDLKWVEVNNTSELSGYRTFDLLISADAPWVNNSMLFTLDSGSFYQDPFGETAPPDPVLFSLTPALAFDTYVQGLGADLVIAGPAITVGGDELEFSQTELDIAWTWTLQPVYADQWHSTARITFENSAIGSWAIEVLGPDGGPTIFSGTVADIVPEPGSLGLLAGVCFFIGFRRS